MNWTSLVDCEVSATQPFCDFYPDPRPSDLWDSISIDLATWAGQDGLLRFTYDTGDSCCSFERGWYIDEINIACTE
jgi:hypothetical protein